MDKIIKPTDLLSTGSTLLNLACTGNPFGGLKRGIYYFLVGDSASGKTFTSMTSFAEATLNKNFEKYRLIDDDVEGGNLINLDNLFNSETSDRIEPPATDDNGEPKNSKTVEEFYYHLDDAIEKSEPFIYVLDSMDGLTSDAELEKFDEHKEAYEKGKEAKGSYGDGKAKKNSEGLRKVLSGLQETGSILVVICQTRDNLGFGFEKKTRSGGRALRFYAGIEIWSSVVGKIQKEINGKKRVIGTRIKYEIKKNRLTGKLHEVEVDIYPSYGIDDIGSCVDYLVEEKWWEGGTKIDAKEFSLKLSRDKLIGQIEAEGQQDRLRQIVGDCWKKIDEQCSLKREKRYA